MCAVMRDYCQARQPRLDSVSSKSEPTVVQSIFHPVTLARPGEIDAPVKRDWLFGSHFIATSRGLAPADAVEISSRSPILQTIHLYDPLSP